ncbi:MAG: TetR/AcrR family transcriptional regulator [Halanaerobiales bacterium]|nr:TetR/AcrR family transcriptional regulator [Halanaerobiales bacterium]
MPKIIDGIEEKIYNAAYELFSQKGYEFVNMKMVANKTGIAVGTLYNYHKNKKSLYLSVLENSWQETLNKLDEIMDNEKKSKKLVRLITVLYTEISARKGIAQELIKSSELKEIKKKVINKLKNKLLIRIEEALDCHKDYRNAEVDQETKKRLVKLIFIEIIAMNNEFHDDKQKNIEFIMNSVNSMLS